MVSEKQVSQLITQQMASRDCERSAQNLISLRKRIEKERKLALHDALTGLFNLLSYDERITQEIARWKRYQRPLSLAVLDVDNFKKINDT